MLSEVNQHKEGNEVNFDLPPKFDEYKDEQEEHQEESEVKANEGEMREEEMKAESHFQGDEDALKRNIFYSRCTT